MENRSNASQVEVPINAARICDAISRIGYEPASALMDIIDNSVAAGSTQIVIEIETIEGTTYAQKNNVRAYRIFDDGKGMTDEGILESLRLGAPAESYSKDSLSKYGLGLKSAGFSLGSRISVLSRQENTFTNLKYVDKTEIARFQKYVVSQVVAPKNLSSSWMSLFPGRKSGTVIEVGHCHRVDHHSAQKTIGKLQDKLGVVYHEFLKGKRPLLKITIKCTGKPDIAIEPRDILHLGDCQKGYDKDAYDCKTPCLVLDEDIALDADRNVPPMHLTVVLFPRDKMANYAGFSDEERAKIKNYKVSRANKGFFIYRNNRLIRWGDDLEGMIEKDAFGVRARLTIKTEHDDILHVDVSKQRITIPEDILTKLQTLLRLPLRYGAEIIAACTSLLGSRVPEGSTFNNTNKDLAEEDPDEPEDVREKPEVRRRKQELVEQSKKRLESAGELPPTPEPTVAEIPIFEKVRYSEKVLSNVLWESGQDPTDGTFVRINKNHHFYHTVLAQLDPGDPGRQALEALLWACAVAENKSFSNLTQFPEETIRTVLSKFKSVLSHQADTWASENQDLFDVG